jgi:hypothetical protein
MFVSLIKQNRLADLSPTPAPRIANALGLRSAMDALLIILFGLLQVADGIVTYLGLRFLDLREANPVLNYCADSMGLGCSIALLKLAELGFAGFLFAARRKMKSRWITATLASAVVFYGWAVTNNLHLVVDAWT